MRMLRSRYQFSLLLSAYLNPVRLCYRPGPSICATLDRQPYHLSEAKQMSLPTDQGYVSIALLGARGARIEISSSPPSVDSSPFAIYDRIVPSLIDYSAVTGLFTLDSRGRRVSTTPLDVSCEAIGMPIQFASPAAIPQP